MQWIITIIASLAKNTVNDLKRKSMKMPITGRHPRQSVTVNGHKGVVADRPHHRFPRSTTITRHAG